MKVQNTLDYTVSNLPRTTVTATDSLKVKGSFDYTAGLDTVGSGTQYWYVIHDPAHIGGEVQILLISGTYPGDLIDKGPITSFGTYYFSFNPVATPIWKVYVFVGGNVVQEWDGSQSFGLPQLAAGQYAHLKYSTDILNVKSLDISSNNGVSPINTSDSIKVTTPDNTSYKTPIVSTLVTSTDTLLVGRFLEFWDAIVGSRINTTDSIKVKGTPDASISKTVKTFDYISLKSVAETWDYITQVTWTRINTIDSLKVSGAFDVNKSVFTIKTKDSILVQGTPDFTVSKTVKTFDYLSIQRYPERWDAIVGSRINTTDSLKVIFAPDYSVQNIKAIDILLVKRYPESWDYVSRTLWTQIKTIDSVKVQGSGLDRNMQNSAVYTTDSIKVQGSPDSTSKRTITSVDSLLIKRFIELLDRTNQGTLIVDIDSTDFLSVASPTDISSQSLSIQSIKTTDTLLIKRYPELRDSTVNGLNVDIDTSDSLLILGSDSTVYATSKKLSSDSLFVRGVNDIWDTTIQIPLVTINTIDSLLVTESDSTNYVTPRITTSDSLPISRLVDALDSIQAITNVRITTSDSLLAQGASLDLTRKPVFSTDRLLISSTADLEDTLFQNSRIISTKDSLLVLGGTFDQNVYNSFHLSTDAILIVGIPDASVYAGNRTIATDSLRIGRYPELWEVLNFFQISIQSTDVIRPQIIEQPLPNLNQDYLKVRIDDVSILNTSSTFNVKTYDSLLVSANIDGGTEQETIATFDSLLVAIGEVFTVGGAATTVKTSDSLLPKITEASSVTATFTHVDSLLPKVTEASSLGITVPVNTTDSLKPKITESSSITATVTSNDSLLPKISDVSSLAITVPVNTTDSLLPKITEASSVRATITPRDSLLPKITESSSLGITVPVNTSDSLLVKIVDSSSVAVTASVKSTDSLLVKITESSSITVTISTTDSLKPKITESSAVTATISTTDSILAKLSDVTSSLKVTIPAIDSILVKISDATTAISASFRSTDSILPKISDTSFASVASYLTTSDNLKPKITEASTVTTGVVTRRYPPFACVGGFLSV